MRTLAPPRAFGPRVSQSPAAATIALAVLALLAVLAPAASAQEEFPAPAAAPLVTAAPASPDNDVAPSWSFRSDDISTYECSLLRGDTLVGDWTACTSPTAYDLTGQPDGAYTFAVRSRGADGAVSESATSLYTLDTSVPALPTIDTLPGPVSADPTPAWTFTGGEGETFECRLTRGSGTVYDWGSCSSPHTVDISEQPDGDYEFFVRAVDENGTRGPARADGYTLDTRAPAAPAITTAPASIGGAGGATLAYTAEAGAQVECRAAAADGGAATDWAACSSSPATFDLSSLPDGAYSLSLRAVDEAGNQSPASNASYVLDTTAPAAPAVDVPEITPETRLQPTFTFASEDGAAAECRLDGPGGFATGWQACASPAPYDLTGQPDGNYTFAARATDAAGNVSDAGATGYSLARDPDAVDLKGGPGRVGKNRSPRWTFAADGAASFQCALELDSAVVFQPAVCGSPRTYSLSGKADGDYKFTVKASGRNGEELSPAVQQYDLDSVAPAKPVTEAKPVSPAADPAPAWRFSGEEGAALECRVTRGSAVVIDWSGCATPRKFDLASGADGDYRVTARTRDAAGNVSTTVTSQYLLDRTAPAVPEVTKAPSADGIDRSPTWTFAGDQDATYSCTLSRGDKVVSAKSSCADARTYNLSRAIPGTYTFSVEATDAAGNASKAKSSSYVLAKAPATNPGGGAGGGSGNGSGTGDGTAVDPGAGSGGSGGPAGSGGDPRATGGFRTPTTSGGSATRGNGPSGNDTSPGDDGAGSGPGGGAAGSGSGTNGAGGGAGASGAGGGSGASGSGADSGDADSGASGSGRGDGSRDSKSAFERRLRDRSADGDRDLPTVLATDVAQAVFPMTLLIILGGFLLVQGRIDRGDPKLADAPIDADPDLEFVPPPTLR